MSWILLVVLGGCQDYGFVDPPDSPNLPGTPVPPTQDDTDEPIVPVAESPVYANTTDELFEVEPLTGARTLVGSFFGVEGSVDGMTDIAIDNEGRVFGGTFDAIYQIDPETADVVKICDTNVSMFGLAFTPDGDLLAAGTEDINRINLANCAPTPVVFNTPYRTSGDIVGHPDGNIYWTVRVDDDNTDGLVRINPQTWGLTYLGDIPVSSLFGLGYADDQLFGFSQDGHTVAVDPVSAPSGGYVPSVVLSNDSEISWWGATTNPVAW